MHPLGLPIEVQIFGCQPPAIAIVTATRGCSEVLVEAAGRVTVSGN